MGLDELPGHVRESSLDALRLRPKLIRHGGDSIAALLHAIAAYRHRA